VAGPIGAAAAGVSAAAAGPALAAAAVAAAAVPVASDGFQFSNLVAALSSASRPRFFFEVRSRTSFMASLTPADLAASSIARWNSRAMLRALAVNRPSVLNITGRSFGPTTISATTPMIRSSLQPISIMT
jgi:hypothetical protein